MKQNNTKIIIASLLFFAISIGLTAQVNQEEKEFFVLENRNEFRLGTGFFSPIPNYINASLWTWYDPSHSMDDVLRIMHATIIPTMNLGYNYRANKTIAMGVSLATDFQWFHSVMYNMQFYYYNAPKFAFYCDLGVGASLVTDADRNGVQVVPNAGIYPIGLKFGDQAGAFAELGYGYKGFINFGAFIKLK